MRDELISTILRSVAGKDDVVLVGGQAIVAWTAYYSDAPEFQRAGSAVTTTDIDFLGTKRRAQELAEATDAQLDSPSIDDATPNSAVLDFGASGNADERVDFLDYVVGPGDKVRQGSVVIEIQLPGGLAGERVPLRIMHPMHCLESKLANRISLGREGPSALAQLEATTPILREFISEMLDFPEEAGPRRAFKILDRLGEYLERDTLGRCADQVMMHDPLEVLRCFADDERIPPLFRKHNIRKALARIEAMRSRRR